MVAGKLRYLVLEVLVLEDWKAQQQRGRRRSPLSQRQISKAIKGSVQANFGYHGAAVAAEYFQVKYFNAVTSILVVRCGRRDYSKIWSAITLIRSIGGFSTIFNLLILSGSSRACRKKVQDVEVDRLEMLKRIPIANLSPGDINDAESYAKANGSLD